jgi:hypothetical protein
VEEIFIILKTRINNVLIPRYMGSIPTEGKNSNNEGGCRRS